jgi:acetyl-CoA carboxylase biotin carboxylase subunit
VPPFYDSMLAKVIVHGDDRAQALARGRRALTELEIEGVATTRELFLEILAEPDFRAGRTTTAYLEQARQRLPSLASQEVPA